MFLILWSVIGAIAGFIVNRITDRQRPALAGDMVLGCFGAVVGGFLFNVVGGRGASEVNLWSLPCAGLAALMMLGGYHALRRTGHGLR